MATKEVRWLTGLGTRGSEGISLLVIHWSLIKAQSDQNQVHVLAVWQTVRNEFMMWDGLQQRVLKKIFFNCY